MTDKEKLLAEIDKCLTETSRLKELVTAFIENVEEDEVQDFTRLHITEEVFNANEDQDWHLKDVLFVPVEGKNVAFRVEHISKDKVYFVAVDAVGRSTMEDMDQFLSDYLSKMPKALVNVMCEMEHVCDGNLVRKSKLTLLSGKNVLSEAKHDYTGADDIEFCGLKTEAERCKNLNGKAVWYWLDTPWERSPHVDYSTYFIGVNSYGWPSSSSNATYAFAVVPCFAFKKKEISNYLLRITKPVWVSAFGEIGCPNCKSGFGLKDEDGDPNKFCGQCGQALKWEENNK